MVGMIMTASMTPAVNLSVPMGFPWKMGRNPKMLWTTGSTETRMTGPRTKIPHNPYTTDGTAASNSTTYVSGIRSHGGESSERKIAMPRLIGTPNSRASADVTRVPYTNGTDPKTKGGTGFHTVPVKNPRPKVRMESCAARERMTVIRTRSPITPNATAVENHRNKGSPRVSADMGRPKSWDFRNGCIPRSRANRSSAMKRLPIERDATDRLLVESHHRRGQRRIDQARSVLLPAWIVDTPPQEVDQRLRLRLGHRCPDLVQLLVDQQVREAGNRVAVRASCIQDRDVIPVTVGTREGRRRSRGRGGARQARRDAVARRVADLPHLHRVLDRVGQLHVADGIRGRQDFSRHPCVPGRTDSTGPVDRLADEAGVPPRVLEVKIARPDEGRPAAVRPVHDRDRGTRQDHGRIQGGNVRVVPRRDFSQEDFPENVAGQVEPRRQACDIVRCGHGSDRLRDMQQPGCRRAFARLERSIRPGEIDGLRGDRLDSRAAPDSLIVHLDPSARIVHVDARPFRDQWVREGRPRTQERDLLA